MKRWVISDTETLNKFLGIKTQETRHKLPGEKANDLYYDSQTYGNMLGKKNDQKVAIGLGANRPKDFQWPKGCSWQCERILGGVFSIGIMQSTPSRFLPETYNSLEYPVSRPSSSFLP